MHVSGTVKLKGASFAPRLHSSLFSDSKSYFTSHPYLFITITQCYLIHVFLLLLFVPTGNYGPITFPLVNLEGSNIDDKEKIKNDKKDQIYTNLAILKQAMISP